MRYKGQAIEKPKPKIIPLLREPDYVPRFENGEGSNGEGSKPILDSNGVQEMERIDRSIYIHANVVLDYSEFDDVCPLPEAPEVKQEGKAPYKNYSDPNYRLAIEDHNAKRLSWIFLKSIETTPEFQWDTVKMDDPSTWDNFATELREAGFTPVQIKDLSNQVYTMQAVDEDKVEEARRSFLAGQARLIGK